MPSAHWDREWYLPFPRFRARLIRLVDKVIDLLESGKYPYYHLDGQTVMIEDYLTVKPENAGRIKNLISSGKLRIGPWYTVPDTFLPSGRALFKNLELGKSVMAQFGGETEVGYTPDSFGLNSQLAQIFRLNGLKYAFYSRGQRLDGETSGTLSEVRLTSPDQSAVLAESEKYSLGNGLVVPNIWRNFDILKVSEADIVRSADWVLDYQAKRTTAKNRLWICGIDHLEPREDLPEIVAYMNKKYKDVAFKISSVDDFFRALERENNEDHVAFGEQRGEYDTHFNVTNTLSSRADIKLLNRQAENVLFGYAEGLCLDERGEGDFEFLDGRALLNAAYKDLTQSHAHDSICTCCVDEAVDDVKGRLRAAKETGDEIVNDALKRIGSSLSRGADGGEILVYNPLPYPRTEVLEGTLSVPYNVDGGSIADENGHILNGSFVKTLFKKRIDIETLKYTYFYEIAGDETRTEHIGGEDPHDIQTGISYRFLAEDIPPMSFRRYKIAGAAGERSVLSKGDTIENELISLTVSKKGITVTDKSTGYRLKDANCLAVDIDDGDAYTYANVNAVAPNTPFSFEIKGIEKNSLLSKIECEYGIETFTSDCPIFVRVTYTLKKASKRIDVKVSIKNQTTGFRLRAVTRSGAVEHSYSDTPFDVVRRPILCKNDPVKDIFTAPCRNLVLTPEKNFDIVFYSKSFYEYECYQEGGGTVTALTLLRSVDSVYKTSLPTKDESVLGKGTRWHSEGDKMIGEYVFEYAVELLDKHKSFTDIMNSAISQELGLCAVGIAPHGKKHAEDYTGLEIRGAVFAGFDKKNDSIYVFLYNPDEFENEVVVSLGGKEKYRTKILPKKIERMDVTDFCKNRDKGA